MMDGKIIMVPDFSGKYVEIDEADMDKYPVDVIKIRNYPLTHLK